MQNRLLLGLIKLSMKAVRTLACDTKHGITQIIIITLFRARTHPGKSARQQALSHCMWSYAHPTSCCEQLLHLFMHAIHAQLELVENNQVSIATTHSGPRYTTAQSLPYMDSLSLQNLLCGAQQLQ